MLTQLPCMGSAKRGMLMNHTRTQITAMTCTNGTQRVRPNLLYCSTMGLAAVDYQLDADMWHALYKQV